MAQSDHQKSDPHVVIIGAGFGGLNAALALGSAPVRVTVIDQHNYHLFQPLLYQVATAGLSPGDIAYPIRAVVRQQKNTSVILGKVQAIDVSARTVRLEDRELTYDYLVLATGAQHSYFGHPEWEAVAPGLKTIEDALSIRRRVLLAFERAETESNPARRQALLTFVIVGAGPTGVEMSGAISEIALKVMVQDFRNIDPRDTRTILIEAGPRILPSFPENLSIDAEESLKQIGVTIRKNTSVTAIKEGEVTVECKQPPAVEKISAETVVWAAGVSASPLAKSLGVPLDRSGRVIVSEQLSIPGHAEVYVIGDLANFTHPADGKPLPGLAPVAIQQGRHAAANILHFCRGELLTPFHYKDRGSMATIGRGSAVAAFGKSTMTGFLAWVAWIFIHILFLIGFRNRFIVLFDWAWSFITAHRAARLITGEEQDSKSSTK